MKRLCIMVEGQTEERFVKDLLAPYLASHGVSTEATCICTKQIDGRRAFRGGHGGRYDLIEKDILLRLRSDSGVVVTTLFDYYGLPGTFPGTQSASGQSSYDRVAHLEQEFARSIASAYRAAANRDLSPDRFIPNLILHEFEGLLFSSPKTIQDVLADAQLLDKLKQIAGEHGSPEEINDSLKTAPSKRLLALYPGYQKPLHGNQIAARIGLAEIRARCPHFDGWLRRLEPHSTK